jgi:tetratricopeptide (TPR) repeat protein
MQSRNDSSVGAAALGHGRSGGGSSSRGRRQPASQGSGRFPALRRRQGHDEASIGSSSHAESQAESHAESQAESHAESHMTGSHADSHTGSHAESQAPSSTTGGIYPYDERNYEFGGVASPSRLSTFDDDKSTPGGGSSSSSSSAGAAASEAHIGADSSSSSSSTAAGADGTMAVDDHAEQGAAMAVAAGGFGAAAPLASSSSSSGAGSMDLGGQGDDDGTLGSKEKRLIDSLRGTASKLGTPHANYPDFSGSLGVVDQEVGTLLNRSEASTAKKLLSTALRVVKEFWERTSSALVGNDLVHLMRKYGYKNETEPFLRKLLPQCKAFVKSTSTCDSEKMTAPWLQLIEILESRGGLAEAELVAREHIELLKELPYTLPLSTTFFPDRKMALADILFRQGISGEEARSLYDEAKAELKEFAEEYPYPLEYGPSLVRALTAVGSFCHLEKSYNAASENYQEAIALGETIYGRASPRVAEMRNLYKKLQDEQAAEVAGSVSAGAVSAGGANANGLMDVDDGNSHCG